MENSQYINDKLSSFEKLAIGWHYGEVCVSANII